MMNKSLSLLVFASLFGPVRANGNTQWQGRPSLEQSLAQNPLPFDQRTIEALRAQSERLRPGRRPESRMIHLAGGISTGSGGGGGIACFRSEQDAERALDQSGRLRPGAEALITRMYVHDYLNPRGGISHMVRPRSNESAASFLYRHIQENIAPIHPTFADKLNDLVAAVDPRLWIHRASLPLIQDTGYADFRSGAVQGCSSSRYVQMALRYEMPQRGRLSRIVIEADYRLMELLYKTLPREEAVLNEAMLILHEALYNFVMETGSWDSTRVFEMNALLFRRDLYFKGTQGNRRHPPMQVLERLNEIIVQNFPMMYHSMTGPLTDRPRSDLFGQADLRLVQVLSWYGQQRGLEHYESIWNYHIISDSVYSGLARLLAHEDPLVAFMYQIRYTGAVRHTGRRIITPEDIYLRPQFTRQILELFCASVDMSLSQSQHRLGYSRAHQESAQLIATRAVQACRNLGVQQSDRGLYLRQSFDRPAFLILR